MSPGSGSINGLAVINPKHELARAQMLWVQPSFFQAQSQARSNFTEKTCKNRYKLDSKQTQSVIYKSSGSKKIVIV